jgi:hypothetical protein
MSESTPNHFGKRKSANGVQSVAPQSYALSYPFSFGPVKTPSGLLQ